MTTDTQMSGAKAGTKEADFTVLAAEHVPPCVSIYASNAVGGESAQEQLPRLKNLLQTASPNLRDSSMTVEEAQALLTYNWRAVQEGQPQHPSAEGLAVFISRDFFGFSHLPARVADRVTVGSEFFVRPLLSLIPHDDRFHILALSQKHVKLFEGSRRGMREQTLQATPENLHEDLEGHSFEQRYQMHTASSRESLQKGAVFHGPSLRNKDRLIHFFRDVDKGVADVLKGQQAPLILAAVDYLVPIYRTANTYTHLLDHAIIGSPDLLSPNELYAAGWKIVEEEMAKAADGAFAVYTQHANTPLTSNNLRETLAAAHRGLVRFLFVQSAGERWGLLVPPDTVHVHGVQEPGDGELLNLAAILTIRHGGHVYVVPQSQLAQGADTAAVFRYALGSQVAGAV